MNKSFWLIGSAVLLLSACEEFEGGASSPYLSEVPEGVREMAAPHQDLSAVKIDPADGCYLYRHVGPVETTFLPLRTSEGRPICSRAS
ncbi:hypothetical protein Q4578_00800 [Shimia thalassica]|uniref:hypothetical protein n=1 Tax=Shimia thalassica TaxID=1715693 RepID=UPI0026E312B1|nr:hypothetical protein [Shimia thalassica]MDO6520097.1 hypothetical protein [Shimia thalassica]